MKLTERQSLSAHRAAEPQHRGALATKNRPMIIRQKRILGADRGYLFLSTAFVTSLLCLAVFDLNNTAQAQKRRVRKPVTRPAATTARIDYSRFSHATSKHQGACDTCHKVPTDNWKKVRDFPDVADYPSHDACVSCHRPQFFRGAKPPICSVCHSKVSPRDEARFAFRNPAERGEFFVQFPHDKHQDVIAKLLRRLPAAEQPLFVRASFGRSLADDKTKHYNNCEICHGPRATLPAAPATGWIDSFVPDAATFRAVPTSHASCFNCHWKSEQPISKNCGGCHASLSANINALLSVNPKPAGSSPVILEDQPLRLSLKFRHAREQHVQECTTCHINITRAATLRGLQPDVPITACSECHQREGLRQDGRRPARSAVRPLSDFRSRSDHPQGH
jgi:hypothetical protein